ncbi:GNAT family N-acetyltransferase [Thermophagus sp. OGC60D27]|uniref:GNAT family N-acetyltransferase n=1 Tax=Thermophagus sp. OGC60D27 TaxID=3458415 RepID=UPI0040379D48
MIKNDKIILRALEPADADLLYKWENQMEIWPVSNTLTPFSRHKIITYINQTTLDIYQTRQLRLMIDIPEGEMQKTIGMIDLFDFDPYHSRGGIGIMIHKPEREKGYAKEAVALFTDYVFNHLGLHQLYCNISEDNRASIKLFESLDFKLMGQKKDWLKTPNGFKDELMYQKIAGRPTIN